MDKNIPEGKGQKADVNPALCGVGSVNVVIDFA